MAVTQGYISDIKSIGGKLYVASSSVPTEHTSEELKDLTGVWESSTGIYFNQIAISGDTIYGPNFVDARSIAYGGGTYVFVGTGGQYSTDGVTWTPSDLPNTYGSVGRFTSVSYKTGIFVTVSLNHIAYVSSDGITWTPTALGFTFAGTRITTDGTYFYLFGGVDGNELYRSANGSAWTLIHTFSSYQYFNGIEINGTKYVAVDTDGNVFTSSDSFSWSSAVSLAGTIVSVASIFVANNRFFVSVFGDVQGLYHSSNGTSWTFVSLGGADQLQIYAGVYFDSKYYFAGQIIGDLDPDWRGIVYSTPDLITFTELPGGPDTSVTVTPSVAIAFYSVKDPNVFAVEDFSVRLVGVPRAGASPLTVDFEAIITTSSQTDGKYLVNKYYWYFDLENHPDEYVETESPTITHIYTGYYGQVFDVKLEVSLKSDTHTPIIISADAEFSWDSIEGGHYNETPFDTHIQPIQFINQSNIASVWYWDFDDGTYSTVENPQHSYSADGIYNPSLTINNGESTKSHTIQIVSVIVCADFGWDSVADPLTHYNSSPTPFEDMPLQFLNSSTNASAWYWDFDDGNFSATENPIHDFAIGTYNVSLSATDGILTSVITKEIEVKSVVADFGWSAYNPSTGMTSDQTPWDNGWGTIEESDATIQFVNNSQDATNYLWDFGDGSPIDNTMSPTHNYSADGIYTITLSSDDGVSYSQRSKNIEVIHTGLVLWYLGNDSADEYYGRLNGTWRPNATPLYADAPELSAYEPDYRSFDFISWYPGEGQAAIEMPYFSAIDFSGSSQFSIRVKVKKENSKAQIFFFLKGVFYTQSVPSTEDYGFGLDNSRILIWTGDVFEGIRTDSKVLSDLEWHDVLWTYDAGFHTIYIDGVNKSLDHNNQDIRNGINPCGICYGKFTGSGTVDTVSKYTGKIDQVQIFNRLITPSTHI